MGNNLGVRLPANVAKAARLHPDQMVRVSVDDGSVTITPVDGLELTLEQRLALFDPTKHGGEAMTVEPLGAENGKAAQSGTGHSGDMHECGKRFLICD